MAFLRADLRPGVDIVLEAVRLDERLTGADLIITGEGQFDRSTVFNKAPVGVARLAHARGIPVIGVAGSLGEGYQQVLDHHIAAVFSLVNSPMTLQDAMSRTSELVANATEQIIRAVKVGRSLR
jgi:glycerate kinase